MSSSVFRRYPAWCLTNLINFYYKTAGLVEGRVLGIVYLYFSEAFVTVSHKILTEKLLKYGLDEQIVR